MPDTSSRRLVILTGARQTGKTTLAKKVYSHLNYINLDAPENRDAIRSVSSANWHNSVGTAVIDEAQKEPSVFEKIKYAYDAHKIDFSVLLGSSQILLLKKIRESLAGRVFIYELWPLLMSELMYGEDDANIKMPMISRVLHVGKVDNYFERVPEILLAEEESIRVEAEKYILQWGGMPALLPLNDLDRQQWLRAYEYTYLERDLSDLTRLSDLEPFKKFQRLSALRSSHILNYSELARDAGVSADTARRYLEYLRLSYQVFLLQPYFRNITSSVVKSPKIYWVDTGLFRQLSGFRGEISGEVYETMVVGEIYKWIKTNLEQMELFFYRTRSGLELDIIIKTKQGILGIEIKSRESVVKSDCRAMVEVAKGIGDEWLGGFCIYRGRKIYRICDPSIWAVPSFRLFT